MADVRGFVLLGAASTWICILPAVPRNSSSTRLPFASGSATRDALVSSKPAVAIASIAAVLAFLGYFEAASREDPSKRILDLVSFSKSGWLASAGVPSHAFGGLICVTLTNSQSARAALPIQSKAGIDPVHKMRRDPLDSAVSESS
eukprot:CAMPEP_0197273474 /NCGR_PEP_ID=MMETSP1432-20130617/11354_1 /TAXON_ID=44447 /ORGANISM="Pseudo-nitzschia delicatissima, Strain UNC1205" /LENGTH=145 /DNA_ID=CAMNT_0042739139 /DNA_START=49 /DNA_END=489 /DNA_ORIENTATION=+